MVRFSEIPSGIGEHAVFFVPHLAPRKCLPSDPNPILGNSIAAWSEEFKTENLYPPIDLDAQLPTWPVDKDTLSDSPIAARLNINMIHISPLSVCLGLLARAGRILPSGGIL
jgi:hypothetical protein